MNKNKIFKIIPMLILSIAFLTPMACFAVTHLSESNDARRDGSPWVGLVSSSSYPYGYRIYFTDTQGNILYNKIATVMNTMNDDFKFLYSLDHIRRNGTRGNFANLTPSSTNAKYGVFSFNNIMGGQKPDFDNVLINQLSLKCDATYSKCLFWNFSKNKKMTAEEVVSTLNKFGQKLGLGDIGTLFHGRLFNKPGASTYIIAEPIFSFCDTGHSPKECRSGTPTELLYWAAGDRGIVGRDLTGTNKNGQNPEFACKMFNSYILTKKTYAAGYTYYPSYSSSSWGKYCNNSYSNDGWDINVLDYESDTFDLFRNKDKGLSTDIWMLNDLITDTECTDNAATNCNPNGKYFDDCCSCEAARDFLRTNPAANAGIAKQIKDKLVKNGYKNFPTSCISSKPDPCIGPNCKPTPEKVECEYKINKKDGNGADTNKLADKCSGSSTTSGSIDDHTSWDCIFKSSNHNDSNVKSEYYAWNNSYCAIYCREKVNYILPGNNTVSYPGRYLVVGNSSIPLMIGPIYLSSTRECSATDAIGSTKTEINYTKFNSDLDTANKLVAQRWSEYQVELFKSNLINSTHSHSRTTYNHPHSCNENAPDVCSSYKCTFTDKKDGHQWSVDHPDGGNWTESRLYDAHGCNNRGVGYSCSCSCTGTQSGGKKAKCDNPYNYDDHSEFYNIDYYKAVGYFKGVRYEDEYGVASCGNPAHGSGHTLSADEAGAWSRYSAAVATRNTILENIKKCNNYADPVDKFKPTASISYNDVVYGGTYNLVGKKNAISSSTTYTDGSTYTNSNPGGTNLENRGTTDKFKNWYSCPDRYSLNDCQAIQMTYPKNSSYVATTTVSYSFELEENKNRYISKPDGKSGNSIQSDNYVNVGFSNLPIHYSTPEGKYNYKLTINGFGDMDNISKYLFKGEKFNGVSYSTSSSYSYDCDYTIDDPCIVNCNDPHTNYVEYRTISLTNPFPGENGTGRSPGSNWKGNENGETITKKDKYITYNRGVNTTAGTKGATNTGYDVYKLDPMYEIDLTPALMKTIKNYNSKQNLEHRTVYGRSNVSGYSDFTLVCKKDSRIGNYTQCTSKIIRDWGVKGCGIGEGKTATKCGTTVAWRMNS